jgi:hypothetical protein
LEKLIPFLIILKDAAVSVGRWIQVHSAFVTAAATFAIAAFTWALWWATRRLWKASLEQSRDMKTSLKIAQEAADAAKDSADALPIMERAYIFSKVIPSRKIEIFHEGFDYDKGLEAVLYLINHGKTPAIIKEIAFYGYEYDSPINDKLVVMNVHAPRESFIGHDEECEEDSYGFISMTKDKWIDLCTIPHKFFVYCIGYVKYATIFGEEHCHCFCWEFDGPTGKFILSPNNRLNYDT